MHNRRVISPDSKVCLQCIHCIKVCEFASRITVHCELDYDQDILKECPNFVDVSTLDSE